MDLGDDLFGDDEEVESPPAKVRELDDEELDSGDDENRHDREREGLEEDGAADAVTREVVVVNGNVARHQIPNPSDGQVSTGNCRSTKSMFY